MFKRPDRTIRDAQTLVGALILGRIKTFHALDINGLSAGRLYPVLAYLERQGILLSWWEDTNEVEVTRRRAYCLDFYKITLGNSYDR